MRRASDEVTDAWNNYRRAKNSVASLREAALVSLKENGRASESQHPPCQGSEPDNDNTIIRIPSWTLPTAPATPQQSAILRDDLANRNTDLKEELNPASERKVAASKTQTKLLCVANRAKHISLKLHRLRGSPQSMHKCLYKLGQLGDHEEPIDSSTPRATAAAKHAGSGCSGHRQPVVSEGFTDKPGKRVLSMHASLIE